MIQTDAQLQELLPKLAAVDRIAVDTEADSLHCYFEKLCLIDNLNATKTNAELLLSGLR
jgi:ribonuclease D